MYCKSCNKENMGSNKINNKMSIYDGLNLSIERYICNSQSNMHNLRLLMIPNKYATIFSAGIMINVGSINDDIKGIAHFLEHMTFKGTQKYPNKILAKTLDDIGAIYNASTTYEYTNYEIHCLPNDRELVVDILLDMYLNSVIEDDEVEKERKVILEECNMRNDMKSTKVYDSLIELITKEKYKEYGNKIIGTLESINNITSLQLREFKDKYYLPQNTLIIISGNFTSDKILKYIEKIINQKFDIDNSNLKDEIDDDIKLLFMSEKNIKTKDRIMYIETKDQTNQTIININFPCYKNHHKNILYINTLNNILSNGISGRLVDAIRHNNGFSYSINSENIYNNEFGIYTITVGVNNGNTEKAIDIILKTIKELKKDGITKEELKKSKNQQMIDIMIQYQKQLSHFSAYTNNYYYNYKSDDLETLTTKINNIKINDINKIINKIFQMKQTYIIILGSIKPNIKEIKQSLLLLK